MTQRFFVQSTGRNSLTAALTPEVPVSAHFVSRLFALVSMPEFHLYGTWIPSGTSVKVTPLTARASLAPEPDKPGQGEVVWMASLRLVLQRTAPELTEHADTEQEELPGTAEQVPDTAALVQSDIPGMVDCIQAVVQAYHLRTVHHPEPYIRPRQSLPVHNHRH
jgi:hypothetical protein